MGEESKPKESFGKKAKLKQIWREKACAGKIIEQNYENIKEILDTTDVRVEIRYMKKQRKKKQNTQGDVENY